MPAFSQNKNKNNLTWVRPDGPYGVPPQTQKKPSLNYTAKAMREIAEVEDYIIKQNTTPEELNLLEEINNCLGKRAAARHLKKRKERLGMQPSPVDLEQWVPYTGREFEAMNGGEADHIPVILEVDAAVHLAQWVRAREWPTRTPWFPLEHPEDDDI